VSEDLTEGQRAKLGVIGGMLSQFDGGEDATGAPKAFDEFSAPIDNAISTVRAVGSPRYAQTREEHAERVAAIQDSQQADPAEAKPKPTPAETLEQVKTKLRSLPPDQRHAAYEKLYDRWSSEKGRELLTEAYEEVIGESTFILEPSDADEFEDEYDGDEFGPTDEDTDYADLLGEFRSEEEAA
jgi:hypothetical protein